MSTERADFGSRLRAAREARGVSLKDIAGATKISVLVLEALERNDASRLPGGIFSRALVRSYAKEVGLDPEQTVREFSERFGGGDTQVVAERARPAPEAVGEPVGSSSGARWLGLGVTVLLVIVWIGVDRYLSSRGEAPQGSGRAAAAPADALPKPVPPALPGLEAPTAPPPEQAKPEAAGTTDRAQAATAPGSDAPPAATQPAPATPADPANAAAAVPGAATAPPPPRPPLANPALRMIVTATSACWISAKVDDDRVAGRTLQPGERLELAAARAIVLTTGNAGGLTYTINDTAGRALGATDEVKTVVITTTNYRTFLTGG